MKRLFLPLAIAGLTAAALATPASATPDWVKDALAATPSDAYGTATFWLDANGAALKKASQYRWDYKDVAKIVPSQSKGADDGKPGLIEGLLSRPLQAQRGWES